MAAFVAACPLLPGTVADTGQHKIELIQQDKAPRGAVIVLGQDELNLYARNQIARSFRQGIRGARLDLGAGRATGFAYVDFPKLGQAIGRPLGRLLSWLLAGERRVQVEAHIRSGAGKAQAASGNDRCWLTNSRTASHTARRSPSSGLVSANVRNCASNSSRASCGQEPAALTKSARRAPRMSAARRARFPG